MIYILYITYWERESKYDKVLNLGNVGEEYVEISYITYNFNIRY